MVASRVMRVLIGDSMGAVGASCKVFEGSLQFGAVAAYRCNCGVSWYF
jgi:hypothetical protein